MLLGHWIEAKSVLGASRALEEIIRIMPTIAHLLKNNEIIDIPISNLKKNDIVLVRPGEKIPSDGIIIEGESFVNEAFLTGESKPIHKKAKDKVVGGSINGEGSLKVRIEKVGEENYISQVIKMVKQAQESRSRIQDLANRASALLFYIALITGIITYLAWFLIGKIDFALERFVTVMVIACPHALGLAIPLVIALSTSITAKNGILIRDRRAFEMIKNINAIVFDKTGTLTIGKFGVSDIVSFIPEEDFLKFSASIEINSEHIIAKAIVEYAKERGVEILPIKEFKALPGIGAYGKVLDKEVYIGSKSLLKEIGVKIDEEKIKKIEEFEKQSKTIVFTIINGEIAGAFALSDKIRKESYEAIKKIKEMGIKVYMLTGDNEEVAKWVANELNIDDYFAQVLPNEKAEKINYLKNKGYKVAMVGDGINDAPALVTADVGIAIGAGTDVAIESADIILVRNDPRDVMKIIDFSQKTYSKMFQNLWWAAGYNIIAIPLATGILYNFGIIINPAIGALIMSLSTIIVALNSQGLKKYEPKIPEFIKEEIFIDPVCGMEIKPENAYSKIEYEGRIIYFCSKICEEKFKNNPRRYLSKIKKQKMNY